MSKNSVSSSFAKYGINSVSNKLEILFKRKVIFVMCQSEFGVGLGNKALITYKMFQDKMFALLHNGSTSIAVIAFYFHIFQVTLRPVVVLVVLVEFLGVLVVVLVDLGGVPVEQRTVNKKIQIVRIY